jgi:hypothetical protein
LNDFAGKTFGTPRKEHFGDDQKMGTRIRQLVLLSMFTFVGGVSNCIAHPGHGPHPEGTTPVHFLTSPLHMVEWILIPALVAAVACRVWWKFRAAAARLPKVQGRRQAPTMVRDDS